MVKTVDLPDGRVIEFPDETDDRIINAIAASESRKGDAISTAKDVGKAAAWAPFKAVAGMAAMPSDLRSLSQTISDKVQLPEWLGKVQRLGRTVADVVNPAPAILPGFNAYRGAVNAVMPEGFGVYEPTTRAGKATDTAAQTALMMGKNWVTAPGRTAALTGAITAGTEGAGAATNDNPLARIAGGLVAGLPFMARDLVKSRVGVVAKDVLGDVTPEQIAAAKAMQAEGLRQNVPLLGTESFDRGHQLASYLRSSPTGNSVLEPFLAKRAGQTEAAVQGGLLAGTGPRAAPGVNAARAQQAASDVISNAEQARTRAVDPFYEAARYENIPPQSMRPVANAIQEQLFKGPIGDKAEKALGDWYNQAFPYPKEAPQAAAAVAASKPRAPVGVNTNTDDVVTAIRKLGGINPGDEAVGSLAKANPFPSDPRFGPVWRKPAFTTSASNKTAAGHSLDHMAQLLYERGYISERDPNLVMDAIADSTMGTARYSTFRTQPTTDPLAQSIDRLVTQLAAKSERGNAPPPAAPEAVMPETQVGRLGRLYTNLGIERQLPEIGATSEQKIAAYPAGQVQNALGEVLAANSKNWRQGNRLYADITQNVIDPLKASPIGVIAGKRGFDPTEASAVERIVGQVSNPKEARPETIRQIYTQLNRVNKQAFPGIVQTYIENKLNAALQQNVPGPNPVAGAKFVKSIIGTPKDYDNFREMMRGVAVAQGKDPEAVTRGAVRLLEVLDRTGRTPGIGSPTQPRGEIATEMRKTVTGDISNPFAAMRGRISDFAVRGRNKELAQALTAPDSVEQLVKLSKYDAGGMTAQYLVASILGLERANAAYQLTP